MHNIQEFIIEFEEYLKSKLLNFKRYKVQKAYVYDIEETVVVLLEQKEEFSKKHFIVKEILNIEDKEDSDIFSFKIRKNIKIRPFCTKFIKEWVTYYPFKGNITEELKLVNDLCPKLKLLERYEKWQGYRVVIAGFQLGDNNTKGYALVKSKFIGGIVELREIGENLLNAYIDFIVNNPTIDVEKEKAIRIKNKYEFIIDGNMCKILDEKYIKKYPIEYLRKAYKIADLKGFWTSTFLKDKNDVPYKLLEDLENNKFDNIGIIYDIYTENMKSYFPKIEDFDKEYFYLSVVYADDLESLRIYNYISEDTSIGTGDKVLVNRNGEDVIAIVINAEYYLGSEVPYPVNKTKLIIKKIESDEELEKYGYKPEDFVDSFWIEDEEDDYDEDEEDDD